MVETHHCGSILWHAMMGNFQDTESNNQLPVAPREAAAQGSAEELAARKKHTFTPVRAMKVEYWHQGEKPSVVKKTEVSSKKRENYAKRSDQMGLLLLGSALLIVILVGLTLYLNNKNYLFTVSKVKESSTAVVDFYQGNHAFSEKVASEKAAKEVINGHQVHGIAIVNDDLEVPLSEQMNSMSEKMKKMRTLQQAEEEAPPSKDSGPKAGMAPLQPTKPANFQSPLEFNKNLPKGLETNQ